MSGVWSRGMAVPEKKAGAAAPKKNAWGNMGGNKQVKSNNNQGGKGGQRQYADGASKQKNADYSPYPEKKAAQENPIKKVVISGVAALQIVKQCHSALPELCSGSLLGLDVDDTLEITHSFPLPQGNAGRSDDEEYTLDVMRMLRDINVDNCCVGWYRSCSNGTFCTEEFVMQQFEYQETIQDSSGNSVAIALVYDPRETMRRGILDLKAYRLTSKFSDEWRAKKDAEEIYAISTGLRDILEEVPVHIQNAELINVFLNTLCADPSNAPIVAPECLDLGSSEYLEMKIEHLMKEVDNLTDEHISLDKADYDQKSIAKSREKWIENRKAENELRADKGEPLLPETEPNLELFQKRKYNCSKIEYKLISKQIDVFCDSIDSFCGTSFGKLFLAEGLQK